MYRSACALLDEEWKLIAERFRGSAVSGNASTVALAISTRTRHGMAYPISAELNHALALRERLESRNIQGHTTLEGLVIHGSQDEALLGNYIHSI